MAETISDQDITFVQYRVEEGSTGRFLMIRVVDDYPTHWMSPTGAWVSLPEDDDSIHDLLRRVVKDPEVLLPKWDELTLKRDDSVKEDEYGNEHPGWQEQELPFDE